MDCIKSAPALIIGAATLIGMLLVGCAGIPVKNPLPRPIRSHSDSFDLTLRSAGQIVTLMKPSNPKQCQKVLEQSKLEIRDKKTEKIVSTNKSCRPLSTYATLSTSELLRKGDYRVKLTLPYRLVDEPFVSVRYKDPNFNSEADGRFAGAVLLSSNQAIKGSVNYTDGDASDWYHVKGQGSTVSLLLTDETESAHLKGKIYRLKEVSSSPKLIGQLRSDVPMKLPLGDEELLIEVVGPTYLGAMDYQLVRKDFGATGRSVSVRVVDLYSLGTGSVAVLENAEGMQVNQRTAILGKTLSGDTVTIGNCTITSIIDSQASCRLTQSRPQNMTEYTARVILGE